MKNYRGSGGNLLSFLTSAVDGGVWSISSPGRFTPEKEPLYPCPYKIKCGSTDPRNIHLSTTRYEAIQYQMATETNSNNSGCH